MRRPGLAVSLIALALTPTAAFAAPSLERTREPAPRPPAAGPAPQARASALAASDVRQILRRAMRGAGSASGAAAVDLTNGRPIFNSRAGSRRIPASVQKLYTTSAALLRFGPEGTLDTHVLGDGELADGTFAGDLYLRGGGDPTFGSLTFTRRAYGTGATTAEAAEKLEALGVERVRGRIFGDDSFFDGFRGVPDSGLRRVSPYVGRLSGLAYDRGGSAAYAASQLSKALNGRKIQVSGSTGARAAPGGATDLAVVESPPMGVISRLTNRPSDNFFAEMLIKAIGARFGGEGSTAAGARVVRESAAGLGARAQVVDGSGLSRGNRTSPSQVVELLEGMEDHETFPAFLDSLAIAGRAGTLYGRMRGTAAQDRCRAKTGTLSNVSALAGYCDTQGGERVAFAFLMNFVGVSGARGLQDRMAAALARYDAEAR